MSSRAYKPGRVSDLAPAERCSLCRRKTGHRTGTLRLRTGQIVCPRCQEQGQLPRLDCGHVVLPGTAIVRNDAGGGESRCQQCAPTRKVT